MAFDSNGLFFVIVWGVSDKGYRVMRLHISLIGFFLFCF